MGTLGHMGALRILRRLPNGEDLEEKLEVAKEANNEKWEGNILLSFCAKTIIVSTVLEGRELEL